MFPRHLTIRSLFLLAVLLGARTAPASADPPGFAFLEVPSGARAAALGGAYAALGQGVESMFWNPAGLAAVERIEIGGTHTEYLQSLRHEGFAGAMPLGRGGLGASVRALYSEPIAQRDDLGNEVGTFGAHDLEFKLGWGMRSGERLRWGLSAQVVEERIASAAATTFAFGAGATWDPAFLAGLRLAVSAENIGPSPAFTIDGTKGADVPLPMAVQTGGSFARGAGGSWQLRGALEARMTTGRKALGLVGAEVEHDTGIALRGGYRINDDTASYSAGIGWRIGSVRLDYAFVPFDLDLGNTHRIGFVAGF
jgi:Uncharacterised protein family (UPF0164)